MKNNDNFEKYKIKVKKKAESAHFQSEYKNLYKVFSEPV